ncbi:MAG: flagellar protein [Clostridiaceae bacterium]|nr:flagellar protein [Clostridiaceae bacterium]
MLTYKINKESTPVMNQQQVIKNSSVKGNFNQILQQQLEKNSTLKFSKHATQRLEDRNINLTSEEIKKLNNALLTAEKKGVKETLILMENRAFIANVKNKTVITAAVEEQLKDNVFTNIDGAVII